MILLVVAVMLLFVGPFIADRFGRWRNRDADFARRHRIPTHPTTTPTFYRPRDPSPRVRPDAERAELPTVTADNPDDYEAFQRFINDRKAG